MVRTPQLWTSIMININLPFKSRTSDLTYSRLATFFDEWFARSGQLLLHIALGSSS